MKWERVELHIATDENTSCDFRISRITPLKWAWAIIDAYGDDQHECITIKPDGYDTSDEAKQALETYYRDTWLPQNVSRTSADYA